jgi:RHS repeat-associated protein
MKFLRHLFVILFMLAGSLVYGQLGINGPLYTTGDIVKTYSLANWTCGGNVTWTSDYGSVTKYCYTYEDCDPWSGWCQTVTQCYEDVVEVVWPSTMPCGTGHLTATDDCGNSITIEVKIPNATSGGYIYPTNPAPFNQPSVTFLYVPSNCVAGSTINYQWQQSYNNSSWADISGAINSNYNPYWNWFQETISGPFTRNTYFRVKKIENGTVYYSNIIELNVIQPLNAGEIFHTQIVKPGQQLRKFYGTSSTGLDGGYNYQWQYSWDNSTWADISTATGRDFDPTTADQRKYYRRKTVVGYQPAGGMSNIAYSNIVELRDYDASALDNKPADVANTGNQPLNQPDNYNYINPLQLHYVKSYTVLKAGITDTNVVKGLSGENVAASISYTDGLGNTLQNIQIKSTPEGNDIISQAEYDKFGRQRKSFGSATDHQATGVFRANFGNAISSFYQAEYPDEGFFYSRSYQESINDYKATETTGKQYSGNNIAGAATVRANNSNEEVWRWTVNSNGDAVLKARDVYTNAGILYNGRKFDAGDLIVTEAFDVYGKKSVSYTNKLWQKVLDKVQISDAPGNDHNGWSCTYYVYDELGILKITIPPLAVKWVQQNINSSIPVNSDWVLDNTISNNLCTKTATDIKGRYISKKLPEQAEDYTVYDKWNRTVLSQDAKQRVNGEWTFTKYDVLSRPVAVGIFTSTSSRETLQTQADNSTDFPALGSATTVYAYTYYDTYTFSEAAAKPYNASLMNQLPTGNNAVTPVRSQLTKGLITGTKVKAIYPAGVTGPEWLVTVSYYDNKGRVIQTQADNINNGTDISCSLYDHEGKILSNILKHQNPAAVNGNTTTPGFTEIIKRFEYDHTGRLINIFQRLNGSTEKHLVQNRYNELGQIKRKILGVIFTREWGGGIETLDYSYDIQGRLKGVNASYAKGIQNDNYFGYELGFENSFQNRYLDGNISGIRWRTKGDGGEKHAYGYNYDNLNRVTNANYTREEGANTWGKNNADYTVGNLSYDEQANPQAMEVKSTIMQQKKPVDNLTYSYLPNSNRLNSVSDPAGDNKQKDFTDNNTGANDYVYDDVGNIIEDKNKQITIAWNNLLEKPVIITHTPTGNSVSFVYDASGERMKKIISVGTTKIIYTYLNGFVYRKTTTSANPTPADTLLHFAHDEGRVRRNYKNQLVYDYFIADYLGNIRTVITEEKDTATYISSFEQQFDNVEPAFFGNQRNVTKELVNATFPYYNPGANPVNNWHSRLNGNDANRRIGSSLILKVMAGDGFTMAVKGFYRNPGPGQIPGAQTASALVQNLVSALLGGSGTIVNNGKNNLVQGNGVIVPITDIQNFITNTQNDPNNQYSNLPKAYLNYAFFDEQFNVIKTGFKRISQQDAQVVYTLEDIAVKNGYIYVWISNESDINVYFDDLSVQHRTGPLLQENAYYPYGLPIEGLSSYAAIKTANKELYQSKMLDDELGLNYYYFDARYFDPQTGRFMSMDPAMQFANGYNGMGGNPVMYRDPDGRYALADDLVAGIIGGVVNLGVQLFTGNVTSVGQAFGFFGVGFVAGVATLYGGPVAAGMISGFGNSLLLGNDIEQTLLNTAISGATGAIAGPLSSGISSGISSVAGTSVTAKVITQIGTSTVTGGTLGAGTAFVMGQDPGQGFINGAKTGFIGGSISTGVTYGVNAILSTPPAPRASPEIRPVGGSELRGSSIYGDAPEFNLPAKAPTSTALVKTPNWTEPNAKNHWLKHSKGLNPNLTTNKQVADNGGPDLPGKWGLKQYREAGKTFWGTSKPNVAMHLGSDGRLRMINFETREYGVMNAATKTIITYYRVAPQYDLFDYWLTRVVK